MDSGFHWLRQRQVYQLSFDGCYFHNGVAEDLRAVLDFYRRAQGNGNGGGGNGGNNGPGDLPINPLAGQLDQDVRNLDLGQNDIQDIPEKQNAIKMLLKGNLIRVHRTSKVK